uniref:Fork-head domain-containing protein n=1 Tax=Strigamia maritima TaxID=126957 RepID=T1J3E0_STRMM
MSTFEFDAKRVRNEGPVADEFESDELSDDFPRKRLRLKTPQQPIDRKQVPKTPLKLKAHKNEEMYKSSGVSNAFGRRFADGNKKMANNGFMQISLPNMCAENETNEMDGSNFTYPSTNDEQGLHSRAEKYIANIKPDPEFYDIENGRKIYFMTKMCSKQIHQTQSENAGRGKRKRKSYDNIECYVSHYSRQMEGPDCPLPEGTKLTKPMTKLVELVARVIFHSPNGMLQVQQVYVALQNRYPYFRFMHKTAINSWKSSIRHALYQKWFYKVKIVTGFHADSKGCYWALNTSYSPREWEMPGQRSQFDSMVATTSTDTQNEEMNDDVTTAIDLSMKRNLSTKKQIGPEMMENSHLNRENVSICKARRRLDMSTGEYGFNSFYFIEKIVILSFLDAAPATLGLFDDLLGVAPLMPSPDESENYGIPLVPCFFNDNPVMLYPNPNGTIDVLQHCSYPVDRLRHCGWWDGSGDHNDCYGAPGFQPVHYSPV